MARNLTPIDFVALTLVAPRDDARYVRRHVCPSRTPFDLVRCALLAEVNMKLVVVDVVDELFS